MKLGYCISMKHGRNGHEIELDQAGQLAQWISSNPWGHPRNSLEILMVRGKKLSEGCHQKRHSPNQNALSCVSFCHCLQDMQGMEKALERWGITRCCWPSAMDHGCVNVSTAKVFPKVSERWCKSRPVVITSCTGLKLWKVSICRFYWFLFNVFPL